MKKLTVVFRDSANAPKNGILSTVNPTKHHRRLGPTKVYEHKFSVTKYFDLPPQTAVNKYSETCLKRNPELTNPLPLAGNVYSPVDPNFKCPYET
jgi:hypothetical protein